MQVVANCQSSRALGIQWTELYPIYLAFLTIVRSVNLDSYFWKTYLLRSPYSKYYVLVLWITSIADCRDNWATCVDGSWLASTFRIVSYPSVRRLEQNFTCSTERYLSLVHLEICTDALNGSYMGSVPTRQEHKKSLQKQQFHCFSLQVLHISVPVKWRTCQISKEAYVMAKCL